MNRVAWIDWAKVIAIYLMVVGHTFVSPAFVDDLILSFHMPAFFIISGYLHKRITLLGIIKQFVLPVLILSALTVFLMLPTNGLSFHNIFSKYDFISFTNDSFPVFTGLWFVFALMISRLLLSINIINKHYKIICCLILIVLACLDVMQVRFGGRMYISKIIFSFPFICLGKYFKEINKEPIFKSWGILVPTIAFVAIALWNKRCDIYSTNYGHAYIIAFIGAIIGSISLYSLCNKLPKSKIIETLSNGTLLILGFHAPLMALIYTIYPHNLKTIYFILVPLLVLLICYPIIKLCLRYCPWVLGKYPKKYK